MRALVLMVMVLAAVPVLGTSCISINHEGVVLFANSDAVFLGRWTGGRFLVEEVVRGPVQVNEFLEHPARECDRLKDGDRYMVVRKRAADTSSLTAVHEEQIPRLLRYLDAAHPETYGTVLGKAVAWQEKSLTLDGLAQWLETVAIKPTNEDDDSFLIELTTELLTLVRLLKTSSVPYVDLGEFVELVRRFPRETADVFNEKVDAQNADEPRHWDVYAVELLAPIVKASGIAMEKVGDWSRPAPPNL